MRIVRAFDAKISLRAMVSVGKLMQSINSHSRVAKKLSHMAFIDPSGDGPAYLKLALIVMVSAAK